MIIYSMTATFGKLEHRTLQLKPGLNILEAPNEWGKSTWCAFLIAMLYGIDTRAKSTKTSLADKERYAPWSGSPMSGRMEINWDSRDITIERSSNSRIPMGVFRAFETQTGMEVPELTATNCGQVLLGVERSVFERTAFLRFSDLPVTEDQNLRSRLNALVTTGDESGSAEVLRQKLRDLKNRCRYNRSGLLPQAEAQREELERKLSEYNFICNQTEKLHAQAQDLEQWKAELENHKATLRYTAAQNEEALVKEAITTRDTARQQYDVLTDFCRDLPERSEAEENLQNLQSLRQQWDSLQIEEQSLLTFPDPPEPPNFFRGLTSEEAVARAKTDRETMVSLNQPQKSFAPLLIGLGAPVLAAGLVLLILKQFLFGIPTLCVGALLLTLGFVINHRHNSTLTMNNARKSALCRRYGSNDPEKWMAAALEFKASSEEYEQRQIAHRKLREELHNRREQLRQKMGSRTISESVAHWNAVLSARNKLDNADQALQQAERHLQTLQRMAKSAQAPTAPDELSFTEAETDQLLTDAAHELQQLHAKLGQCQGQMNALGSKDALYRELDRTNHRIEQLELTYAALEYAQNALSAASAELQRRFAPRISRQAQDLFSQLTGGRYNRLSLSEDLSIHTGSVDEDILHSQQWRSDGTVDQLYLALRLAVARELVPNAPLILDDALVRFDNTRLSYAMEVLRREAEQKQVILFTCQGREAQL